MKRTTIMMPEELQARAVRRAQALGISLGELIRRSLRSSLSVPGIVADPLFADRAVFDGESPPDLAAEHDRYLYGEEP